MRLHRLFLTALILTIAISLFASGAKDEQTAKASTYTRISAEEAKKIMDSEKDYIILDARSQGEYDSGHIPGAIVIPHTEVKSKAGTILKDKNQKILVYCRSGNRSKQASSALVELGYTNVYEFGGISSWPYEIVK